jgi:hypothetical protein
MFLASCHLFKASKPSARSLQSSKSTSSPTGSYVSQSSVVLAIHASKSLYFQATAALLESSIHKTAAGTTTFNPPNNPKKVFLELFACPS